MDIYENIIVGNYLFGLGIKMGVAHSKNPVKLISVNLLQQTPLDATLADAVLTNDTFFRIIEFKRFANKSSKEPEKLSALRASLQAPEMRKLEDISRKIHWYVASDFQRKARTIKAVPYLDFLKINLLENSQSFEEFIEASANAALTDFPLKDETELYRRYFRHLTKVKEGVSGGTGCLVVSVNKDGRVSFAVVDNVLELLKKPEQILELGLKRELRSHGLSR